MRAVWAFLLFVCVAAAPALAAPTKRAQPGTPERGAQHTRAVKAARARAEKLGLGTLRTAAKLLAGAPEARWIPGAPRAPMFGTLQHPVPGAHQARGFGSGAGGYHQAIDLAGALGSPVHAAASGIVGYAGDEVRGYGNLILLVHEGGAVTLYGHNQRNLVVAGQRVNRGQRIALLGSTGLSKGPHVHFELLVDGENCDPGPLLRPAVRDGKGALAGYAQVRWRKRTKRPAQVACHARKHHPGSGRGREPAEEAPDEPDT